MIDPNKVVRNFEKFFESLSYEERENYLKEMGFSFGTPEHPQNALLPDKIVHPLFEPVFQSAPDSLTLLYTDQLRKKEKKSSTDTVRMNDRLAKNKA